MLREFLYVDVARVRSLLSQLDRGVVESVVERRTEGGSGSYGASLLGVNAIRSLESGSTQEESRSLQDLLFTIFEEAAQSEGLIRELTDPTFSDPTSWESAHVHHQLVEGEIVRLFCPVLIIDPGFVRGRFARFVTINDALAAMAGLQLVPVLENARAEMQAAVDAQVEAQGGGRDQQRRERTRLEGLMRREFADAERTAREGLHQETTPLLNSIIEVLNAYLASDALSVRFLSCGDSRPELAFSGSLLGRDEYIQRERDALFARHGSVLQGWTALLQIASIPTAEARLEGLARDFSNLDFVSGGSINRAALEQSAIHLLGHMDALGVSEGPLWPAISAVPLAIYRIVPRSDAPASEPRLGDG